MFKIFKPLLMLSLFLLVAGCGGNNVENLSAGSTNNLTSTGSVPGTPVSVTVTAGDGINTITWPSVSGASSYNLYWGTSAGVTTGSTRIRPVTSPYPHSGLTNGSTYYYKVSAINAGGESGLSPEGSGTPGSDTTTVTSASITVTATPKSIEVLSSSTLSSTVLDSVGNSVPDGTSVAFSLGNPALGSFTGGLSSATVNTTNGVASVVFTAASSAGTGIIIVDVKNGSNSVIASNSVTIDITVSPASSVITATPATMMVMGTSSISLTISDTAGNPVPSGTQVSFVVNDKDLGSIPSKAYTVPVTDVNNVTTSVATTTLVASNLPGNVTVTASVGGITNSVAVPIVVAETSSIEFIDAVPTVIGIQGSGQPETSDFSFMVRDANGNPVVDGTSITFSFTGPGGGEELSSTSSSTVNGVAVVTLRSGFVAGPVRITGVVDGTTPQIITSSTGASIGGGRASQAHFDLATEQINLAGFAFDNVQTVISAYLADRFGNFNVLENSSISFYTEAGAIDRSGVTNAEGAVSVNFRTQLPAPVNTIPQDGTVAGEPNWSEGSYGTGLMFNPRDGWVSVLATTRGEEAFNDANANGEYDSGEPFTDIGEPFIDKNDNGIRNDGTGADGAFEEFVDTNLNGVWDSPNGKWDNDITIFHTIKQVFTAGPSYGSNTSRMTPSGSFTILAGGCINMTAYVSDFNQNRLTPGTIISLASSAGSVIGGSSFTLADGLSTGPTIIGFSVCDAAKDPAATLPAGFEAMTIAVTTDWKTPGGTITSTMSVSGQLELFETPP